VRSYTCLHHDMGKTPCEKSRFRPSRFRPSRFILFLCLCAASSWAPSARAFSQASAPPEPPKISGSELSRLIEISARLVTLNETLRNELSDSKRNSEELARTLGTSKNELDGLRSELEALRTTSTALALSAENSSRESDGLRAALTRADSSLLSLEASFEAYRKEAEGRTARLERSASFFRYLAAALGALSVGGWGAFLVTLIL